MPPSRFFGRLTVNGRSGLGERITAFIGGVVCGTGYADSNGSYRVDVLSADERPGCGVPGATVQFQVEGVMSAQTATWRNGAFTAVDLAVTAPTATPPPGFTPVPVVPPTATPRVPSGRPDFYGGIVTWIADNAYYDAISSVWIITSGCAELAIREPVIYDIRTNLLLFTERWRSCWVDVLRDSSAILTRTDQDVYQDLVTGDLVYTRYCNSYVYYERALLYKDMVYFEHEGCRLR
jgi:hypothetical protein